MDTLSNIKIVNFPNLIRTHFLPSSSQKSFIWNTDKMNYGHYVRFEALWDAFLQWIKNNKAVFELLCKSDLPPEIIEVIMIKAKMWFSNEIFETLQKEQCKIIEKFDTYIGDIKEDTICIKELLKHIEIQHGHPIYTPGKGFAPTACDLIADLNEIYGSIVGRDFAEVGCPPEFL